MSSPHYTILLADDDEANRELLTHSLERHGYGVLLAHDGEEALTTLRLHPVDLVLLDISMPRVNGLEVLKKIRGTPSMATLPVLMSTGHSASDEIVRALELGANDYLTKPLDLPVAIARIQAQLRGRKRPSVTVHSANADEHLGAVLEEKYQLTEKLGTGGFGVVYKAVQLGLQRDVAIKLLHLGAFPEDEGLQRFQLEGISASRLSHPNVVQVHDFCIGSSGVAFLVMELLAGQTLEALLRQKVSLLPPEALRLALPVADALVAAHRAGIIHRDIKPSNLFLHQGPEGEVPKVLDFGVAKLASDTGVQANRTEEGFVLGTLNYMAPERLRVEPYDGKVDVYALGCMLFQMLAGRLPFVTASTESLAVAMMHLHHAPPQLRTLAPHVSPELEALVHAMLAKEPRARPDSEQVRQELRAMMGLPLSGDAPVIPPERRPTRRTSIVSPPRHPVGSQPMVTALTEELCASELRAVEVIETLGEPSENLEADFKGQLRSTR